MLKFLKIFILALLVLAIQNVYGIDQPDKVYKYESTELDGYPDEAFVLPRGQPYFTSRANIINKNYDLAPRNRGKPYKKGTTNESLQNETLPRNRGEPRKNTS
jgi:hypothetical protein